MERAKKAEGEVEGAEGEGQELWVKRESTKYPGLFYWYDERTKTKHGWCPPEEDDSSSDDSSSDSDEEALGAPPMKKKMKATSTLRAPQAVMMTAPPAQMLMTAPPAQMVMTNQSHMMMPNESPMMMPNQSQMMLIPRKKKKKR